MQAINAVNLTVFPLAIAHYLPRVCLHKHIPNLTTPIIQPQMVRLISLFWQADAAESQAFVSVGGSLINSLMTETLLAAATPVVDIANPPNSNYV